MASEWPMRRLEEVAELSGGFAFKSEDYAPDGRFILRTLNIKDDGSINRGDAVFLPLDKCELYKRFELEEHDTLFVMVGATLGKVGYVRRETLPALLNQNMWRIRGRNGRCEKRYLQYAFRHTVAKNLGWASGSARDFVRRDDYRTMEIPVPPLPEQKAIAAVLGALDDKIELNRRINATLEAIARALFQSWFVDFDPSAPNSTAVSPIPKGWEEKSLDQIATYLNGLALQKFPPGDGPTLSVIKIAQLRQGNSSGADRCNTNVPSNYVIQDGDVLFSWSGSLEVELWCGGIGALNQHLFKVTSAEFPKWFYYFWTRRHLEDFRLIAAGKATTMGHIQRQHLTAARVLIPPRPLLDCMTRQMSPLIETIIANQIEARTLASLRDTLLPKLLSGHFRIGAQLPST